jgi:hypothetical protein
VTTLNQYEVQVADLLHDPNQQLWSLSQLDLYINEARRQVVMDTGCLRSLQTAYLTAGVESYTFGQVTGGVIATPGTGYVNPSVSFAGGGGSGVAASLTQSGGAVNAINFSAFGSGYSTAPVATVTDGGPGVNAAVTVGVVNVNTYDILGVSIIWGAERYALLWRPFSDFSAKLRVWLSTAYQRQPAMWAVYGNTQFFVGPPPDQSYQVELDTIILPTALADYLTADPIPVVMQDPVKFYAAHLAKLNNQAYGEAEMLLAAYQRRVRECEAAYTRRIPNPYEV